MEIAARLDHYGRPAWIVLMVLGFIIFWPVGLAILGYMIWSGRMGSWKHSGHGRWHFEGVKRDKRARHGQGWGCSGHKSRRHGHSTSSSGNHAFDEYREETIRRLEDEQDEFHTFLERLRQAKDKAEFDEFMDEQRRKTVDLNGTEEPDGPEGPSPQPAG